MVSPCATGNCIARPRRRRIASWLAAVATVVSFDSIAAGTLLYDADSGVLPDPNWGWSFLSVGSGTERGMLAGSTFLDTTASEDPGRAGYSMSVASGLDSATGFILDFSLRLTSESHGSNNNRSGFSIIVLDSNNSGVELSFWTDEVWAKNADAAFSHAEGVPINTDSFERTYRLTFLGAQYTLTSAGAPTLPGTLRDNYAQFVGFPYNVVPYGQSNYIFFGDNTSSAAANFELSSITLAPVPEPAEWLLMLAGLGCVVTAARRQRGRHTERVIR